MNQPSHPPALLSEAGDLPALRTPRPMQIARDAGPTLGAYANIVRARKWLVLAVAVLLTLAAAVAVQLMTPIYRGTTTILIESNRNQPISAEQLYGVPTDSREFFQTQAEFLRSREVGMRVVKALGLDLDPSLNARAYSPGLIGSLGSRLTDMGAQMRSAIGIAPTPWGGVPVRGEQGEVTLIDGQASDPLPESPPVQERPTRVQAGGAVDASARSGGGTAGRDLDREAVEEMALERYRTNLDIVPVRQSQLVEIRYESPDATLAARIANETADAYITADLDARFQMQQSASRWLNDRLTTLRQELDSSERRLQAYREEIGMIETPNSSMGGNVPQLDSASQKLLQARIDRTGIESIYNQVRGNSPTRYDVPEVFNNEAVASARQALSEAERRMRDLQGRLGQQHPEFRSAQAEVRGARENLQRQGDAVISSIQKRYEVARATERSLEREVTSSRGNIQEINRKEGRLSVLQRDVQTNQDIYQTFLSKVKETDATSDFRTPIARVVDSAVPGLNPVKPPKMQIVAMSCVLGLMLGALLAIALDQRTAVIRTTEDVEPKLGVPLLVAVPRQDAKMQARLPTIQHDDPNALFAESVRSALTGVRLSLLNERHPVVAFTSTLPGEGKSTLALNFAIEQARTRRTLLIDADLRKPSITSMLKLNPKVRGLADAIRAGNAEGCIQYLEPMRLAVLPAARREKNAHDLLMGIGFSDLLDSLKPDFDLIVIDTPPVELVSDALPIGRLSSGVIYVVKSAETLAPMARRGIDRIASSGGNVIGVVLNNHDFDRANRYYGDSSAYGSYYGKKYGNAYGYGAEA